jgi:hypothetical protein
MTTDEKQDEDRAIGERIAEVMRAHESAVRNNISQDELQTLKAAAGRLEQLLADAAGAETEDLKKAASRLDQLLKELGAGKDIATGFRVRRKQAE